MKCKVLIPLMLVSTNAAAVEFDLSIAPGYDSNPFTLSNDKNPESGLFTETKMELTVKQDKFRWRAKVSNELYEVANADNSRLKLNGRYRSEYKVSDNRTRSTISLAYNQRDKTYVSHSTGAVGTFAGQSIADRYDYDSIVADMDTRFTLSKATDTTVGVKLTDKDYHDYSIPGLSNFDYSQLEISNLWEFEYDNNNDLEIEISVSNRDFDDKRTRLLDGSTVAGTNLKYDMLTVSFGFDHKFDEQMSSNLSLRYATRSDNGAGYYDTEEYRLKLKLKYEISESWSVSPNLTYIDRVFVNNITVDPNEISEPAKDGFSIGLKIDKALSNFYGNPMEFFIEVDYDDFDSNDPDYRYDRIQLLTGLQISFGS